MSDSEKNGDPVHASVPLEFLEAVANIRVDFGHGEYELEDKWIEFARGMVACSDCKCSGHNFVRTRQYLLPARRCSVCGLRQIELPCVGGKTGGWVDRF